MTKGIYTTPKTYSATTFVSVSDRNVYESGNVEYLHEIPACELKATADGAQSPQSISPLIWTKTEPMTTVTFDTEDTGNNDGMAQAGTIVVPETAAYLVGGRVKWDAISAVLNVGVAAFVNDDLQVQLVSETTVDSGFGADLALSHVVHLTKNDVVDLRVRHTHTAAHTLLRSLDDDSPARLTVVRVRGGI